NVIRGDARNPELKEVQRESLRRLYSRIAEIQSRYAERRAAGRGALVKWLMKLVYVGVLTFHHRTQLANLEAPSGWPMPCTAGETSAVVDFDGRVRACELREPIGDLRKVDMNFNVFWESPARQDEPRRIACDQCWCTHVCFIHDSLRYSWRA